MASFKDDPEYGRYVAKEIERKKKRNLLGKLKAQGKFEALGKALPKFKEAQEQWKIQDAERKLKKLKLDQLTKLAEASSQQQQMQAARNSV